MIIGINGYIGSGKDTIGAIIQELTRPPLEGDKGYKNMEGDIVPLLKGTSNFEIKKFAEKLKQIASMLTGIPREKFEDQEFKKTFLSKEWNYQIAKPRTSVYQKNKEWEEKQMTVRELLQKLGTEAIRDGLHTNAWVNALFADYKPTMTYSFGVIDFSEAKEGKMQEIGEPYKVYPNWIITDVRFPNEAQAIKDKGGVIIRVDRKVDEVPYQTLEQRHPSETSLDDWRFDYYISNNGTLDRLKMKVEEVLQDLNILN